jgi:hypothetical protein
MHLDVYGPDEPSFTSDDGIRHLSRADAVAAVERCVFITAEGWAVTHCMTSQLLGADWDKDAAVEHVNNSVDRAWIDHAALGTCLALITEGRLYYFAKVVPA